MENKTWISNFKSSLLPVVGFLAMDISTLQLVSIRQFQFIRPKGQLSSGHYESGLRMLRYLYFKNQGNAMMGVQGRFSDYRDVRVMISVASIDIHM
jgi:hypothetical protein